MENLQKQIDELKKRLDTFNASATLPMVVSATLKDRLLSDLVGASSITAASETIIVSVGSAAAKPMTGFITLNFNGIVYNVPYY